MKIHIINYLLLFFNRVRDINSFLVDQNEMSKQLKIGPEFDCGCLIWWDKNCYLHAWKSESSKKKGAMTLLIYKYVFWGS